ncbi:hypothetical protein AB0C70_38300 [Streptomyces sp. NPDC048564]|uniref:hypothetical protein n=1 Tax=Streptomyces sp. NPDC048564 TaxID=3155760 RepID=UPI00343A7B56
MSTELEYVEVVVGELVEDEDCGAEGAVETYDSVAAAVLKAAVPARAGPHRAAEGDRGGRAAGVSWDRFAAALCVTSKQGA